MDGADVGERSRFIERVLEIAPPGMLSESHRPSSDVVVWAVLDSSFVQRTVSPTEIATSPGPKAKFSIETAEIPERGGLAVIVVSADDPPEHAARSNAPAMRPADSTLLFNMVLPTHV